MKGVAGVVKKGVGYSSPLLTQQGLSFDPNSESQIHRDEQRSLYTVSMLGSELNMITDAS